jgi:hypothetical protein
VNANWIAADGPDSVERISGMSRLTGFPVRVSPALEVAAGASATA